jgi:hypothetical protein
MQTMQTSYSVTLSSSHPRTTYSFIIPVLIPYMSCYCMSVPPCQMHFEPADRLLYKFCMIVMSLSLHFIHSSGFTFSNTITAVQLWS